MRLGVCLPFRPACTSRARRTITLPRRWLSNALKFDKVTYQYEYLKPILTEASFMVKEGSKMALVGQNGSGKSTIFKLVNGVIRPDEGHVHVPRDITVATSLQAIPPAQRGLRVHEFFQRYYPDEDEVFLEEMMNEALHAVALHAPRDRIVSSFSGGQQARLLLASALIQHPDLLLLDEPTNNLDATGIRHLTDYLAKSKKTCLVISHDAAFLDAFTTGILYLDIFTKKVNEHSGTYHETIETIAAQIAKTKKEIGRRKRLVHQKRSLAKDIVQKSKAKRKKNKNSVRIDASADRILQQLPELKNSDVAIDPFTIPTGLTPDELAKAGNLLGFNEVSIYDRAIGEGGGFRIAALPTAVTLKAKDRLILTGPNGCGKTTLLEQLVKGRRCFLKEGVTVGYYRQDFSELDYETTVRPDACLHHHDVAFLLRSSCCRFVAGQVLSADCIIPL
jgi:ATPase subunit of ABC transporter with duplicated ATPase domains